MKPLADGVLDGLRPFQQRSVERAWTSLTGKEGSRRFLVADEVGLGKTRVASAVIRQFAASGRRKGRGQVVIYFAPNAEVSRQNLRVLRTDAPANEPRARLTLLPLMAEQLERPGMHVLAFTPQTSLRVGRGTGTAEERALLLRLLRPVWRCGDGDDVVHVFRDRAQLRNFRGAINQVADVQTSSKLALAFQEAVEKHPDYKREFRRLRAEVGDGGLPKAEQRARRKLLGELRRLLAGSCLIGLSPKLVIFDEFQRYPDVLRGADVPGTLEHALLRQVPALLLSATPYKMTAAEQDPGAGVELTRLLRFLLADEAAAARAGTQLGELRRSFIRLRPPTQSGHVDSVHRARAAAAQVEATLSPVMSRWQRPDDGAGSTPAERLLPAAEDVRAHLAFQRAVDGVADVVGLRHRATVEYWKSAPYLANFMRGYRVKQAIDEAWKHDERRRQVQRALARGPHSVLPMRDVERYRPVPTPNARYRVLSQMSLEHGQWQALWVPPALSPYAPEGRFATVAARGATKTLVFSGWRVVPSAVAALLGYEAEQRAGSEARARNT
ncbi:MAG: DEAD/DEAH box helicase family protein, partial [Acidimicrobiales bacterium]